MDFQYDDAKFIELLLHVAGRLRDDRAGGGGKLGRVLFFTDFAHVRTHRQAITGAEYQKLEHGPSPRPLVPVRTRLVEEGAAELVVEDFLGHRQRRLVPLRPADLTVFDTDERATIDKTLSDLAPFTARQVTELSHDEPWWSLYELGGTIPYHAALLPKRQIVTPAARKHAEEIARRYGIVVDS